MATGMRRFGMALLLALTVVLRPAWAQAPEGWPWATEDAPDPSDAMGYPEGFPAASLDEVGPEAAANETDPWTLAVQEQDLDMIADEFDVPAGGKAATRVTPGSRGTRVADAGIDVSAFEELLRENIELRRQLGRFQEAETRAIGERQRMEQEMRELERQVAESVALIQKSRLTGEAAPAGADPAALEALRSANAVLQQEVNALRSQIESAMAAPAGSGGPAPGSDLYRQREEEVAQLRRRAAEAQAAEQSAGAARADMQAERDAAYAARDEARATAAAATAELREVRAAETQMQRALDRLAERVPAMETELAALRDTVGMKDRELAVRNREVEILRLEMEKREQRLIKAERMTALLEKSRAEVKQVGRKDERDMHYNMAGVYARDGRYREAEQAYLKALRADPTDAAAHYNLGILYEDVFRQPNKAAMHYRAYLKLAPGADDVDEVKGWLLQLELQ